ncbi:MAG: DNA repair protein RecN [Coprothermobacterota bacterium]|nr:DNA repair protein RecN [Coprothermobacterota bacterium]
MIENIWIKNLAIVKELSCELEGGLNVFTGETGAGKSLVVDAISFLLGGRSQIEMVGNYGDELRVEASLIIDDQDSWVKLQELGLDDPCLYIMRTLSKDGRSKARINGKTVPVGFLKDTLSSLVHLHGQQEHEALVLPSYQLDYIDRYAGERALILRAKGESLLSERKEVAEKISNLEEQLRQRERQKDILQYEINEIESARLKENEDQLLLEEKTLLLSGLQIKESLEKLQETLRGEGPKKGFLNILEAHSREIAQFKTRSDKLGSFSSRLENIVIELEDLSWECNSFFEGLEFDPEKLEAVEERLDIIARLKRKYGNTIPQILDYLERAKESLRSLESVDLEIENLISRKEQIEIELGDALGELRALRREKAKELQLRIVEGLRELGIPTSIFKVEFQEFPLEELRSSGLDRAEFWFSANPGEMEKPLGKVASGGELSRLMLVMKSVLADVDRVRALIFDEVDAGIGGKVGEAVARKLKEISRNHQVICITHLPQIAGAADVHFAIEKSPEPLNEVRVKKLKGEERVKEIARMLAGSKITPTVLAHARELLGGKA